MPPPNPPKPNPNPPLTEIEPGLYLGDSLSSRRKPILLDHNITAVLSLSDGRWVHWRQPWYTAIIHDGKHLFVPALDSMTHDLLPDLARMCAFIDAHRGTEDTCASTNILVHCEKGVSRSAAVLVAYLMRTHQWGLDEALASVAGKRKIKPNQNFREQLRVWEETAYEIWEDAEGKVPKPEYAAFLEVRAKRLEERGLTGDEPIVPLSL